MSSILDKVNEVYAEQNPSNYIRVNKKNLEKLEKNRRNFFVDKLHFPPEMFKNKELLDLGSGSGLMAFFYQLWGARCTLIEYDKNSYLNSLRLFKRFPKKKYKITKRDLFKFRSKKRYNIVHCSGVLHHTDRQKKGIQIATKHLRKGGYLIYGIGNQSGFFQRALQRLILYKISSNKNEIISNAKIFFKNHLLRAARFGGRSIESVIYDTYINPKIDVPNINEIMQVFKKNKIKLYSSFPDIKNVVSFLSTDFLYGRKMEKLSSEASKANNFYLSEHQWLTLTSDIKLKKKFIRKAKKCDIKKNELTKIINDKSFENANINFDKFLKAISGYNKSIGLLKNVSLLDSGYQKNFMFELQNLIKLLRKKNNKKSILKFVKNCKFLFKKYNGLGMTFFIGYKN